MKRKQIFRVWAHPKAGGDVYAYDFYDLKKAFIFSKQKSSEEWRERPVKAIGKSLLSAESYISSKEIKEAMKKKDLFGGFF